uniref:Uncharacterized protein n=1 Tax=Chrysemys picta bellii TaxID=8478 RepID=A0A8C3F396_CHRPI
MLISPRGTHPHKADLSPGCCNGHSIDLDSHRPNVEDLCVPPVLALGRDTEEGQDGVIPAGLGHRVVAGAVEIIHPSIKGVVMQVTPSPACGLRDWHTLWLPIYHLTNSSFSAANHTAGWNNYREGAVKTRMKCSVLGILFLNIACL